MSFGGNDMNGTVDYISNMPDIVTSNILNRLPLIEAVTTSILSKNWRYKWTLLTDVVIDEHFFYYLGSNFNNGLHVTRLLLQLQGPIRRFLFFVEPRFVIGRDDINYEEIHAWLMFLAQSGIEELLIHNWYGEPVTLPTQMYTRLGLKHLELHHCTLPSVGSFKGYPNLLTLELLFVKFQTGTIWDFIAGCPSLESLKINPSDSSEMRLFDIAQLGNLKKLYLAFGYLNHVSTITSYNIYQLSRLPKLESLTLDFDDCKLLEEGSSWMNIPVSFESLKDLTLTGVDFRNNAMVTFIIGMIRGSPRLQNFDTRALSKSEPPLEFYSLDLERYGGWSSQLQTVVFRTFPLTVNELLLIKFVLACSPLLNKLYVNSCTMYVDYSDNVVMNLELATELLRFPRSSPTAVVQLV